MRIGLVTTWFDAGTGYVARACRDTLARQHEVFVLARGGRRADDDPFWNGPHVTWASPHPCLTGIHRREFTAWVRRHALDTVLFFEQRHWDAVLLARQLGLRTGSVIDYYTAETVPLFWLFDFLVCQTRRHHGVFVAHPQACLCPWGTDLRTFAPAPAARPAARAPTFLISSGWDGDYARRDPALDRRGTGPLLEAFRQLRGNSRLLVHSQVPLDRCPEAWKQHVQADPRIEFRTGTVKPPGLFHLADVYVYPSRLDGIGLTLPEALACGLPAITTDNPPMNEFVTDGVNGRLVRVREYRGRADGYYWAEALCDLDHLARTMQDYVDHPERIAAHGRAARERAERDLCWERNSACLGDWIVRQARLAEPGTGESFADLARRAAEYDRHHEPTPWQSFRQGAARLLRHGLAALRRDE